MKLKKIIAAMLAASTLACCALAPQTALPAAVTAEAAGKYVRSEITSYPDYNDNDVSVLADGKYKAVMVVYGSTTCGITGWTMDRIIGSSWSSLSDLKLIFADVAMHSNDEVAQYAKDKGGSFRYCCGNKNYSSSYPRPATYKDIWFYANQIGLKDSLTYPVITISDANDNVTAILNPDFDTIVYGDLTDMLWSELLSAAPDLGGSGSSLLPQPDVVKSAAGAGQVTVVCSKVPGGKNYKLFYTANNGASYTQVGNAKGRKWVVTGLKAGVEYKFLVLTSNGTKWSKYTKGECYAPATPTLPNPKTIKSTAGKGRATVVCSAVSGAVNYKLYYTTDNGRSYTAVGNSKARKWTVTGLKAGTEYKFLVRVSDGKKWSAYTKGDCFAAVIPT